MSRFWRGFEFWIVGISHYPVAIRLRQRAFLPAARSYSAKGALQLWRQKQFHTGGLRKKRRR